MEEQIQKLKNEIAKNQRKIAELEKQKLPKVPKRDIEKFKKYYNDTIRNKQYKYFRFIEDMIQFGGLSSYEIGVWFGEYKKHIKDVEEARQFITSVMPEWDKYFLECIEELKCEDEDEDV